MDKDYLQRQMDILWRKVQEKTTPSEKEAVDFASAFEDAQRELQNESLNLLRTRFEKEKVYWENLVSAKEEAIGQLRKQLEEEQQKTGTLRAKIQEAQDSENLLLQQTFGTLELQKRALSLRIQHMEQEVATSQEEALAIKRSLGEEKDLQEHIRQDWQEKEKHWMEELHRKELEQAVFQQEGVKKSQEHNTQVSNLKGGLRELEEKLGQEKAAFERERSLLKTEMDERDGQINKLQNDLLQLKSDLDTERDQRRQAFVEKIRGSIQQKEDRKKFVEEILSRENKIKELQDSLDRLQKEKGTLRKKEEDLSGQEELLRRRREDWVDSIRTQTSQQLNISGKIIDVLNKIESGDSVLQMKAGLKLPPPPPPSPRPAPAVRAPEKEIFARGPEAHGLIAEVAHFLGQKKGLALTVTGFVLFLVAAMLLVFEGQGIKSMRAQKFLEQGNDEFTKGDIVAAYRSLEKASELDPENTIIRNSFTLVLGEIAEREFFAGRHEKALEYVEELNRQIPGDPDVLRLRNDILNAMGRNDRASPSRPEVRTAVSIPVARPAPMAPARREEITGYETAVPAGSAGPAPSDKPLLSPDAATPLE